MDKKYKMSWKERYWEIVNQADVQDIENFIEALLKETEQRVAQDFLMQCFEADNGNHIISTCELEQLKEKYKGVE